MPLPARPTLINNNTQAHATERHDPSTVTL